MPARELPGAGAGPGRGPFRLNSSTCFFAAARTLRPPIGSSTTHHDGTEALAALMESARRRSRCAHHSPCRFDLWRIRSLDHWLQAACTDAPKGGCDAQLRGLQMATTSSKA